MMATQIRLKFNEEGFRQILMSDGVKAEISSQTQAIKQRADANVPGESKGFYANVEEATAAKYTPRWVGVVVTADHAACVAESENGALTKAVR